MPRRPAPSTPSTPSRGRHVSLVAGIALIVAIRTHQPGDTVEFTVVRGDSEDAFQITLDGEVG